MMVIPWPISSHALRDAGKRDGSSALTQQQMAMYEPGALDLQVQPGIA